MIKMGRKKVNIPKKQNNSAKLDDCVQTHSENGEQLLHYDNKSVNKRNLGLKRNRSKSRDFPDTEDAVSPKNKRLSRRGKGESTKETVVATTAAFEEDGDRIELEVMGQTTEFNSETEEGQRSDSDEEEYLSDQANNNSSHRSPYNN